MKGGGVWGLQPPFQISKIKESNKTKQKIEENSLEKEEDRKSGMFVLFSSPELKAQVSFSDCLSSIVCLSVCLSVRLSL